MTVPLEVERLATEAHCATDLLLRRLVARVLVEDGDLRSAVPGVLLGVELVRRGRLAREAIVADELLEHARRGAVGSTVHRLDEGEQRDALERAAVLAPR